MAYCRMQACPAERMNRSRLGHSGSEGPYFMTLVQSTWARGARARAVPVAGEHEGAIGAAAVDELAQVLVGRRCVANLELGRGADLHDVAYGEGAVLRIAPEDVSDQEVAPVELRLGFVDHPPEVDAA